MGYITLEEACLKSLEEIVHPADYREICDHIMERNYCNFTNAKTPDSTISTVLGNFIRKGDTRVKLIKKGSKYKYYLTEFEQFADNEVSTSVAHIESPSDNPTISNNYKTYLERSLHKLLSSYLKANSINSKTIFHEKSNGKDSTQTWTHPDMVGIRFLSLQSKASRSLMNATDRGRAFELSSYEIKKEINNDSELKQAFFQAVSNSSWANLGYLAAFKFNSSLHEEMERLNQSFGIGIIEISSNPFQSKVLFPSSSRDLDFQTIDKLCNMNINFETFIEKIEKIMTAGDRYYDDAKDSFEKICDDYFLKNNQEELEKYCAENFIPISK